MFRMIFAFAIAAFSIGLLAMGQLTPGIGFGLTLALLYIIKPFLPSVTGMPLAAHCDGDPVEAVKEIAASMKETREKLDRQQRELDTAHRTVLDAVEKGMKLDKATQDNIDAAIAKANETGTQFNELAQRMDEITKAVKAGPDKPETLADGIAKALEKAGGKDRMSKLYNREQSSMRLEIQRAITNGDTAGLKREPFIDSLVSMERQDLRIRDLLTLVPVDTDSVRYGQQTLRDNKARIVAEGTKKPYSNYKWEPRTAAVETIAHLAKLTVQALQDAPRLIAEVQSEMVYGYRLAEEEEILNGDGTSGHLSGLIHNATPYALPAGMDGSNVLTGADRLRVAILQIHLARMIPNGHVLNPINVAELDLMRRDPDQGGGYLYSRPDGDTGVLRMWRLPVVESASMTVGEFLTGSFKMAANLYQRTGIAVAISTENDDDFENNMATMRVEGRVGLGVRRPHGLVTGKLRSGS